MLQMIYGSNKFSIHQEILVKGIIVSTKILSSTTVFNIDDNVSLTPNQHIRMISEGS